MSRRDFKGEALVSLQNPKTVASRPARRRSAQQAQRKEEGTKLARVQIELASLTDSAERAREEKDQQIRAVKIQLEETSRQLQTSNSDRSRQSNQLLEFDAEIERLRRENRNLKKLLDQPRATK